MLTARISPYTAPNFDLFAPARRSDERGLILGAPLDGAQSYTPWIGLTTVRELALKHAEVVGLVPREQLETATDSILVLQRENAALQQRVDELETQQERIAGLVASGFRVTKAAGRPKTKAGEHGNS